MRKRFCGDIGTRLVFALAASAACTAHAAPAPDRTKVATMHFASANFDPGLLLGPRDEVRPLPSFVWELRQDMCRRKLQCESQCLKDLAHCLQWPLSSSRIEYCEERTDACMDSCPDIDC